MADLPPVTDALIAKWSAYESSEAVPPLASELAAKALALEVRRLREVSRMDRSGFLHARARYIVNMRDEGASWEEIAGATQCNDMVQVQLIYESCQHMARANEANWRYPWETTDECMARHGRYK